MPNDDDETLILTLPSDASSSFTGHSLTDARKQKAEGSSGTAVGNHRVPRMLPDCPNRLAGAVSDTDTKGRRGEYGEGRELGSCTYRNGSD